MPSCSLKVISLAWGIAFLLIGCLLAYQDSKGIPWAWQDTCERTFWSLIVAGPLLTIAWIPPDSRPWCDLFALYLILMSGMLWLQKRRIIAWLMQIGSLLLVMIAMLLVCVLADPYFLEQSIQDIELRRTFEHVPHPQATLSPTMLLTLDATLLPILHFLAECGPLYHRHNLHGTSYCEVEQMLAHLSVPLDADITSHGASVSRLSPAFCHGLVIPPSTPPSNKYISPDVRLLADQLLQLRSHFAYAINAAQYNLLPLLDRLYSAASTVHQSLSTIDPETLNIFDKAFTNSCPPASSSPFLTYSRPWLASEYCSTIRPLVYPGITFSWLQLFLGNLTSKLRVVTHQAKALRSRLEHDLEPALKASIALPDEVYTITSNLKVLPTLIASAADSYHVDTAAENGKVLKELEKLNLRADQTWALMRGREFLQEEMRRMLRVTISGSQASSSARNLSSLASDVVHFALSHEPGRPGLLTQASIIYDVWVQRGRPIRDVSRGWLVQEGWQYADRLDEARADIRRHQGKAALPPKKKKKN